ncbi:SDR family oxidoreductase [Hasllibacter sp. MH4015]|uniref:SDR family oxidoreductase n=1 Tax=Hasllibacter sp. MH4015 TaxID=2854029 RepID=UPI001CD3BB0F|nr:SDR family oxidoreductase [Hasllibacter sp. MH4015]
MKQNATALVTGANRGIGSEVARQLAEDHGMKIWLGARDVGAGRAAADRIAGQVRAVQLDVSDPTSVRAALAEIGDQGGGLDVLVNNAGVDYDTDQPASRADLSRVRRAFDTNFFGAWDVALHAIPLLRASPSGRIVNVSSGAGALSGMDGGIAGYGTSKAALNALTLKLAAELASDEVLVNAVCPGWVATDMGGGGRPIPEGARGVVWAATLPDDGPTGGFFRDGARIDW